MIAATRTCAPEGVGCYLVRVEARVTQGLPSLVVVGLADTAVREGRERVRSAIRATTGGFPVCRAVVNLSPASRRKGGASFDLAIAVALLAAAEMVPAGNAESACFMGELGLDGELRPIHAALPAAIAAAAAGVARLVVPTGNASEAALAGGPNVYAASSLADVVSLIENGFAGSPVSIDTAALLSDAGSSDGRDFADVAGQSASRRALEIAAAGDHHVLLSGPPGSGKTMLARRLPTILPAMSINEAIETTSIHSVAGLNRGGGLIVARPFRAPHHTTSGAGMVGGGTLPSPGEVSLAHNGVLFLDELPEFAPHVLNQLREPIEDGRLTISRAGAKTTFPARFSLVAAMNPCPCGYYATGAGDCRCDPAAVRRYQLRVSGPLIDRFDLNVSVPRVAYDELRAERGAARDGSAAMRRRVVAARELLANAGGHASDLDAVDRAAHDLLGRAVERLGLSARQAHKTIRVSRTIAALANRRDVIATDVAEALQYRSARDDSR